MQRLANKLRGFSFKNLNYFMNWNGEVKPKVFDFKYQGEFEEDLVKMSKAGVSGKVIIMGTQGEHYKYRLDGKGRVELYNQKPIEFNSKPSLILK